MRINRSIISNFNPSADVTFGDSVTISSFAGVGDRMVIADEDGLLATQAIPGGTIGGSGTTNYIPKFTASTTLGNSLIYDDGTNIGIGTVSPVSSAGYIFTTTDATTGSGYVTKVNTTTAMYVYSNALGSNISEQRALPLIFETSGAERMRITAGGNVLVGGTTDGGQKLQITGAATFSSTISASSYYSSGVELITSDGSSNYLKTAATLYIQSGTSTVATISNAGAATFNSTIKTAAPTGYTAQPWKLGDYTASGITPDGYILVEINGNLYTIPALAGLP